MDCMHVVAVVQGVWRITALANKRHTCFCLWRCQTSQLVAGTKYPQFICDYIYFTSNQSIYRIIIYLYLECCNYISKYIKLNMYLKCLLQKLYFRNGNYIGLIKMRWGKKIKWNVRHETNTNIKDKYMYFVHLYTSIVYDIIMLEMFQKDCIRYSALWCHLN